MKSAHGKRVLVTGASIAGLSTAWWLTRLGYEVTVVELAREPRRGGAAVNIQGEGLASAKRMGILTQMKANQLRVERWEFKNADDDTDGVVLFQSEGSPPSDDDIEIERAQLVAILVDAVQGDVAFMFDNSITALCETADAMHVSFTRGEPRVFDMVFGCDGLHSAVRRLWFGLEAEYACFMKHYFSLTTVNRSLIPQRTSQLYNVPGKLIMLNAYNGKTDIVFCFSSSAEISYDYRDGSQQRKVVAEQFVGIGWRADELLDDVAQAEISYFDKLCQIRMPSWTKGRVALVGDAAYCASAAAGMGASLAMHGAAVIANALESHDGDFTRAFVAYNVALHPFIAGVQATALTTLNDYLVPQTEAAIRTRNRQDVPL
jgi:2-polyprenyl-6-methoxyphenol hydroxylase-like FAD-dependent oxidoreductase